MFALPPTSHVLALKSKNLCCTTSHQSKDFPALSLVTNCIISPAMLVTNIQWKQTNRDSKHRSRMKEDKAVMLLTVTGKQDINVGHFCAFSISVQSIMSREWCIYCSLRYYLFIVDDGNNPLTVTYSETSVGTDLHRAEMTQRQRGAKRRLNARQKAFNTNYSLFVRCITAPPSQGCVKAISA